MKNPLKEKLLRGEAAYGPWQMTTGYDTSLILSSVGADCIMIDQEHGSMDLEKVGLMVSLIQRTNTVPLVRVPWHDMALIKRALDTGAGGIMIPMVNDKETAEKVVSYCKYPPEGVRGAGASRATLYFSGGGDPNYIKDANKNVLVILQIEHYKAVENLEEILSVPGIDVAFVGPVDLSYSMNIPGQTDNPDVQASIRKVAEMCKKYNVVSGIFASEANMQTYYDMGYRLLLGGIDGIFIYQGAKSFLKKFEELNR
ncbi:MAG: hypothetical protein GYA87_07730 [Christensenellaceae bacterium]|nr:hypothetical protein [Christensenellaceae bacterium]